VRPVVLVHGWTGDSGDMTTAGKAIAETLAGAVAVHQFDFSPVNDVWAGDAVVSGCLAAYIDTVSQSFRDLGGDGRVIVVGYSMSFRTANVRRPRSWKRTCDQPRTE
jgi:pimeloyl-ACP methyl ester carboxylesterase